MTRYPVPAHEPMYDPQREVERTPELKKLQDRVVDMIADGLRVRDAMAKVDRSEETYRWWRKTYPDFSIRVERARAKRKAEWSPPEVGEFAAWRKKYMRMETYWHQLQWVDILEGRPPRELDETQTYYPGRTQRVMINCPPFHAKTMTLTIDYVTYRICKDPNVRIIIISESRVMSEKMLHGIVERLTNPRYEAMHNDFGPAGGFKVGSGRWTHTMIYVGNRDSAEKDPTVEVLGIGGQIYGARADLIIMDDTVTLSKSYTPGQREKMIRYIDQDVSSRLDAQKGVLLVVGTRVGHNDVYAALLKRDEDKPEGRRTWSYLAQPAVMEYGDTPAEWRTLWPETTGEDGVLVPMWDGEALELRRDEIDGSTWNLVYQQQQIAEDSIFPEEAVMGCIYAGNVGPLGAHIRPAGMDGLYVVAGLDPAAAGFTAITVLAVDKATKVRYVLDVINNRGTTPARLREFVASISAKYRPNEWRIEKNGLQTMISQDPEIRQIITNAGGRVVEHHTGQNKWDAHYGVNSLASLFLGALETPKRALIAIPKSSNHRGIIALLDQLITWDPEAKGARTDVLMSLWFADLACRKVLEGGGRDTHVKNRWASPAQLRRRRVLRAEDIRELSYA